MKLFDSHNNRGTVALTLNILPEDGGGAWLGESTSVVYTALRILHPWFINKDMHRTFLGEKW